MSERQFRVLIGLAILAILYYEVDGLMWGLIGLLLFEGVTNRRIPGLLARLRARPDEIIVCAPAMVRPFGPVIAFDAERAWRLLVASMLIITWGLFPQTLWFFPWFMGFAIFGAGLSGVCPMLISLQFAGFR